MVEILSSIVMGGVAGWAYFSQSNGGPSDAAKIQRICANAGLTVKEDKHIRTIQLQRKTRYEWGSEYAYRIPLGLSAQDFEQKRNVLEDGLNNKRTMLDVSISDLKSIDWRGNIFKQLREIFKQKRMHKEIELDYDGLLRIRVYNEPLTELLPYETVYDRCRGWQVPIGVSRTKFVSHDFDKIPHMIVSGLTRYGKSVFLKNVITTLVTNKPQDTVLTLVDLKGGLTFQRFSGLTQTRTVATDVSETLETLQEVQKEMNERMKSFWDGGSEDVREARLKERHFIIIDEGAEMASAGITDREEKKKHIQCERAVSEIARIGGALGYRIIFATQYPTGDVLPRQVKQNADARLCFRLKTAIASTVVLDEEGAEQLPLIKGRAIYQTDRNQIVQTPFIENEHIDDVIRPHITIKPREGDTGATDSREGAQKRSHTLIISET